MEPLGSLSWRHPQTEERALCGSEIQKGRRCAGLCPPGVGQLVGGCGHPQWGHGPGAATLGLDVQLAAYGSVSGSPASRQKRPPPQKDSAGTGQGRG